MSQFDLKTLRLNSLLSSKDKSRVIDLEKKYGNICYTPLDLPLIIDNNVVEQWDEKSKRVSKIAVDVASKNTGYSRFNSIDYVNTNMSKSIWTRNNSEEINQLLKNLTEQIYDYLPIKFLVSYSLWSSNDAIGPHRDQASFYDLPSSFRIMLHDENPKPTLFVSEAPKGKIQIYKDINLIPRLEKTNSFIWNNFRTMHGSFYDSSYKKILLIIGNAVVDWEKYDMLIERSIKKYQDEVVYSKFKFEDFI